MHGQSDSVEEHVHWGITRAKRGFHIEADVVGGSLCAGKFIDSFRREEAAWLGMLIGHQLVSSSLDQQEDHADLLFVKLLLQLRGFDRRHRRCTSVLFFY